MKLINYLTPIISIMVLINTLILTFLKDNLNIFLLLIPLLLLTILIFIKGLFFHKKDIYQKNINTYLLIYFFLLILITFIYHRRFTNQFIFHIIPGHIFIKFLNNDPKVSLFTLIYNYLGNFFILKKCF